MNLQQQLGEWWPYLSHVFKTQWMGTLGRRLGAAKWCQPQLDQVFRAFSLCSPENLKVIIIGQDPYIKGEADGLAFSSRERMTPSLQVVFEEINRTHPCKRTVTGLDDWAEQGVLLLNSVLTTEMEQSRAHAGWGWELFVQEVLHVIRELDKPHVFMLWGKDAQNVLKQYKPRSHNYVNPWKILKTYHPQAQNWNPDNKFVGCNHFIEANLHLMSNDAWPIWWPDPWELPVHYDNYCETLLKQIPHATAYFTEVLRRNITVRNSTQPPGGRISTDYTGDLPF